ncbi:MAG: single-stranded DNA-binding protein [Gemmatimonadaceae bacterium]|nr:single-stranded DNA-binding protein [Gemmatimonadaceae bacterium]
MGSVNKAILIGNLGKDAELRYTSGGTPVASCRIATTERFNDREGNKKEDTQWHNIVIWGKTAEAIHTYLVKGKQVYVEGKLQTRKWQNKEGVDQYTTEVRADRVVLLGGGGGAGAGGGSAMGGGRPQASRPAYGGGSSSNDMGDGGDFSPVDTPNDDDIPF